MKKESPNIMYVKTEAENVYKPFLSMWSVNNVTPDWPSLHPSGPATCVVHRSMQPVQKKNK